MSDLPSMRDDSGERHESAAYRAGYRAFAPGLPRPECPYQDTGQQLDWERGWGNAHGDHQIRGGPQ